MSSAAILEEPVRHPSCANWRFPPADRPALPAPLRRVNLRELMARPLRFEHHLTVVARIGCAQVEVVVASEPLYFAHVNISDEYAMSLRTGDALLESVPFLTLLSDPETGRDVGRIKHQVGDLVLHPHALLHWPGRLRPPFATFEFPPGTRRAGLSAVFCGAVPRPAHPERPLFVSAGRAAATKAYDAPVPFLLAELHGESARMLGRVGDASMELLVEPEPADVEAPRGAYLLVLEAGEGPHFDGDLIHVPPAASVPVAGLRRALKFTAEREVEPPPAVWEQVPAPPFAPFEDGQRGQLPVTIDELRLELIDDARARVSIGHATAEVPRYWLARMLFRLALHGYAIGYLETYGGLFYDDTDGRHRLGLRAGGSVTLDPAALPVVIEQLYRAVAPPGYVERL